MGGRSSRQQIAATMVRRLHAEKLSEAFRLGGFAASAHPAAGVRGAQDLPEVLVCGVGIARRLRGGK